MLRKARRSSSLGVLALCSMSAAAIVATTAQAAGPVASAAAAKTKTCDVSGLRGKAGFPSYVESLSVRGATCPSGVSLIKSYQACRVKNGGPSGKCKAKVSGYTCHEKRNTSPTTIIAVVSCTRGASAVNFSYSQFR
jgi:hypothetical protein